MYKNNKRYYTINQYFKDQFGEKVIKLAIDGGFTCPNRDGTLSDEGCIFCDEVGSGAFAGCRSKSISEQMEDQIALLSEKWPRAKYIAYFQSFSNTYDSIENLKAKYDEALSFDNCIGLAIATRPDCINDEVLELLSEYNKKNLLWVELGLQTIHEKTGEWINRGYNLDVFHETYDKLKAQNIKSVIHLIFGFPGEKDTDMMTSVDYISNLKPFGVKIHLLHIIQGTSLAKSFEEDPFEVLTLEHYLSLLGEAIARLDSQITVHRITGDGKKDTLIAPRWTLNKRSVLNGLDKYLKEKDIFQGQLSQ